MMQHIATKRQDVAALPIDTDADVSMRRDSQNGAVFSETFRRSEQNTTRDDKPVLSTGNDADTRQASKRREQKRADHEAANAPAAPSARGADSEKSRICDHVKSVDADSAEPSKLDETSSNGIAASQAETDDIDWLAYVEQVRAIAQDGENNAISAAQMSKLEGTVKGEVGEASSLGQELAELLSSQGSETRRGHDKIPKIPELIAKLGQQMLEQASGNQTAGLPDGQQTPAALKQLATAIADALQGKTTTGVQSPSDADNLAALTAQLKGDESTLVGGSDAELLVSLIQGKTAPQPGQSSVGQLDTAMAAGEGLSEKARSLSDNIVSLDKKQTDAVTQNVTQRITELVPGLTEGAKKQVTDAIAAGMAEMKNQVAQGHEPGLSLRALVTDALQQAEVTVTPALRQGIDQQLTQVNSLLNAAQATSAAISQATQLTTPDVTMVENSQARSESSAAARQSEGLSQPVNIHQPEGQKQLTEKIRWMVNSRNMMAEIRMDPPEMGSMQVRVNVQGDAASVSFVVQSQQAREALSQAEPRLKEMLAEQGIELGESAVHQHNSGQSDNQSDSQGGFAKHGGAQTDSDESVQVIEQPLTRQAQGGIDYYA